VSAELVVTYFGAERGRTFDIVVNGHVLARVALDGRSPDTFSDVVYPIPSDVTATAEDGLYTVQFVGRDGSRAGPVYGLRLLRRD
jgi:hypothetical protein